MSLSPSNISTLFGQYPTCDSITDVIATFHQPKILYELCAKEIAGDPIPNTTEHKTLHGILFKNTLQEEVIKKCIEQVKDVSGSLPLTKEIVWEVLRAPTSYMEHSRNRKSEDPLYAQCFHHFLREVFAFGENLMGFYGMLNEVIFANNSTHVEIREIPTFFQKKEMNEKKPLENQCVPCGSTEKISTYVWIGSISINVVSVVATVFFFFSARRKNSTSNQNRFQPTHSGLQSPYPTKLSQSSHFFTMPTSTTNPSYDIRFSRRTKPPLPPLPSPHIRDSKYEEIHDGRNAGPSLLDEAGYLVPAPV